MTDHLLHSFHTEVVDLLYFHIFDKVQRTRHRGKALALYEELESCRPPRLSTVPGGFRARYESLLSACTCRLLDGVPADALAELVSCVEWLYRHGNFDLKSEEAYGGSVVALRREETLRLRGLLDAHVFEADLLALACCLTEAAGPPRFRSVLYPENTSLLKDCWMEGEDVKLTLNCVDRVLKSYGEEVECARSYVSVMRGDLSFMEAIAEFLCSEGRSESSDLVNVADNFTTIGDRIRVSEKPTGGRGMWFQMAGLRLELISFFEWCLEVHLVREMLQKEESCGRVNTCFEEERKLAVKQYLSDLYAHWSIFRTEEGGLYARGDGVTEVVGDELMYRRELFPRLAGEPSLLYEKLGLDKVEVQRKRRKRNDEGPVKEDMPYERPLVRKSKVWDQIVQTGKKMLENAMREAQDGVRAVARLKDIVLTAGARKSIMSSQMGFSRDAVRVFLHGIIAPQARHRKVAFAMLPEMDKTLRVRLQKTLREKDGIAVLVFSRLSSHFFCGCAYQKNDEQYILLFNGNEDTLAYEKRFCIAQFCVPLDGGKNAGCWAKKTRFLIFRRWPKLTHHRESGPMSLKAAEFASKKSIDELPTPATLEKFMEQSEFEELPKTGVEARVRDRLKEAIRGWESRNSTLR